jgi:hypothetical protein
METLNKELISRLRHLSLLILFILILGSQSSLIAQTQKKWQWLNQIGSDSWDIAAGVVCNSKNHLFVAGSFNDTLKCNLKNIKSSGNHDVFIAIFDDSGKIKELSSAGGKGDDHATCICETSGENVIIGGIFKLLPILRTTISLFLIDNNHSYDDVNQC